MQSNSLVTEIGTQFAVDSPLSLRVAAATVGNGNASGNEDSEVGPIDETAEDFFVADAFDNFSEADDVRGFMWEVDAAVGRSGFDGKNRFEEQLDRVIKAFEQESENAELFRP